MNNGDLPDGIGLLTQTVPTDSGEPPHDALYVDAVEADDFWIVLDYALNNFDPGR